MKSFGDLNHCLPCPEGVGSILGVLAGNPRGGIRSGFGPRGSAPNAEDERKGDQVYPSNAILDQITALLAADATTLAPAANGCKCHLAKQAFTPGPNLLIGDLVEADFDGYAALTAGLNAQQDFTDPVSGLRVVQILEPAGGWHFEVTGVTNLPQTIYGYYFTNNAGAVLYASALIIPAVNLTGVGQGIDLPNLRFTFLSGSPN